MKMRLIISAMLVIAITGCATPYQSSNFNGGYSEIQIDDNVFQVRFNGNHFTSQERSYDFALLRCAEVALKYGYKYFIIENEEFYFNKNVSSVETETNNKFEADDSKVSEKTVVITNQSVNPTEPSNINTIVCFKDKPEGYVFNAELIAKSVKRKYDLD